VPKLSKKNELWEDVLGGVIAGGAGLTKNLASGASKIIQTNQSLASRPVIPQALPPATSIWGRVKQSLTSHPSQLAQQALSNAQQHQRQMRPVTQLQRPLANIVRDAEKTQNDLTPSLGPVGKAVAYGTRNLPTLLTAGGGKGYAVANTAIGMTDDLLEGKGLEGAAASALLRGNSMAVNAVQPLATDAIAAAKSKLPTLRSVVVAK
jgi:hypothetical protein